MEDSFQNRTGYRSGQSASLGYGIGHVGDLDTEFATPMTVWLKDGVPVRAMPTNTPGINGRVLTSLDFTFVESDAGVYQCVFTDTARSELFLTVPIRLDTGKQDAMQ